MFPFCSLFRLNRKSYVTCAVFTPEEKPIHAAFVIKYIMKVVFEN